MRPVADLLAITTISLLVMAFRRRRNRFDLLAAAICTGFVAVDVSRLPSIRLALGLSDLALAGVVVVAWFNVVGFPRAFVRLFRAGYRSAEWDFVMRLHDEKARLDRILVEYRSSEDWLVYRRWQAKVLKRGEHILREIDSLKPPSDEWSAVRDGYVDLYAQILGRIRRDELPNDEATLRDGTALKDRADVLRIAYRVAARQWMQGTDRS